MTDETEPPINKAGNPEADKLRIAELEQELRDRDARLAEQETQLAGSQSKDADPETAKRLATAEAQLEQYAVEKRDSEVENTRSADA